jgi:hypothetical protein
MSRPKETEKVEIGADGETKKVYLDDMPDRVVVIGAHLSPEEEKELIEFLNKDNDVFAWSAKDLQGVAGISSNMPLTQMKD